MKKLNENQKKWVLTSCLASVLSFNLFMGLTGSTYGNAAFASKAPKTDREIAAAQEADGDTDSDSEESQPKFAPIITENGKIKVKYIQEEDGQTTAIVPEKTSSGWCYEKCGTKFLLPKNFSSSKDALEQALRKAMKNEDGEVAKDDSSDEDSEIVISKTKKHKKPVIDENDDQDVKEDKDIIALEKRCENKEDDSRLQCFSTGMLRLLKDKKKDHAKENVLALYKKEIEPALIESLTDARDSDRRENGQQILEDLLSGVAKKYNYLRERMVKLSALAVIKTQQEAQKKLKQADMLKTSNPAQALALQRDGYARKSLAESMAQNLDYTLQTGLESAQFSRLITENQITDLYTSDFANVVNPVIQGMQQNPLTYVIQSSPLTDGGISIDANGNLVQVSPSSGAIGQLRAAGGGIIIQRANGLTAANVVLSTSPLLLNPNGNVAGSATIVPYQGQIPGYSATAAPVPGVFNVRGN